MSLVTTQHGGAPTSSAPASRTAEDRHTATSPKKQLASTSSSGHVRTSIEFVGFFRDLNPDRPLHVLHALQALHVYKLPSSSTRSPGDFLCSAFFRRSSTLERRTYNLTRNQGRRSSHRQFGTLYSSLAKTSARPSETFATTSASIAVSTPVPKRKRYFFSRDCTFSREGAYNSTRQHT